MAIRLESCKKLFMTSGSNRRPLYRQLLTLHARHRRPGATIALQDASVVIPNGSRIGVVGANGAGKSTLLRMIAGIYKPTAGDIKVDGRVCCFFEPGAGAAPALPVRDNAYLYASLAGLSHQETKESLPRILDFCSLTDQEFTWVEHLSFGMQQRLFLSILLEVMRLNRAEVFLFDEFLMGVDQSFRSRVETALTTFPSGNQIVMHASHDHDLMLRTCSHAILVADGTIRHFGATEEVLEKYYRG